MPKLDKALRRDRKRRKKRDGMQIDGRSIKTVIVPTIKKKRRERIREDG